LLLENGFAVTILENVEIKDYRKIRNQKTKKHMKKWVDLQLAMQLGF
jgi:hypothetical protein